MLRIREVESADAFCEVDAKRRPPRKAAATKARGARRLAKLRRLGGWRRLVRTRRTRRRNLRSGRQFFLRDRERPQLETTSRLAGAPGRRRRPYLFLAVLRQDTAPPAIRPHHNWRPKIARPRRSEIPGAHARGMELTRGRDRTRWPKNLLPELFLLVVAAETERRFLLCAT